MKSIAELVIRVSDLMEAEGRTLLRVVRQEARTAQGAVSRFALGLMFLLVAMPAFVVGLCLAGFGMMLWLETAWGRPAAAFTTGVTIIAIAGACVWIFKRKMT